MIIPLRREGNALCMPTSFYNALWHNGIEFEWSFADGGVKFFTKEDYEKALQLQNEQEVPQPEAPKVSQPTKTIRHRLF